MFSFRAKGLIMNMFGDHKKNYFWLHRELLLYTVEVGIRVKRVVLISRFAGSAVLFLPTQQGYWFLF